VPTKPRKTWREKLADDKDLPKVITLTGNAVTRWGGRSLVIAAPHEVDALMRTVPRGRVTTINHLRAALAQKHRAETTCPITTGIFSWIAAHAAEEGAAVGEKKTTPYWRTLKKDGELNAKYPGGIAAVRRKLAAEGHTFITKGKRVLLRDLDRHVFSPTEAAISKP
jgi:alkylated DNA nucleotide flippase Atl1